jgi:predicted NBD/HSP70 family sugar kinase
VHFKEVITMGIWGTTFRTIGQEYKRVWNTPGALHSGEIGLKDRAKLLAYKAAALAAAPFSPEGRKIDAKRQSIVEDVAIVWDLGGTNLRVAAVNAKGEIITEILKTDTEGMQKRTVGFETLEGLSRSELRVARDAVVMEMAEMILKVRAALLDKEKPVNILNVAGSFAGPLTAQGTIIKAPNVVGFEDFNLAQRIMELTKIPSFIVNDAIAGARSEEFYGLGRAVAGNFGWVTVSTGYGGTFRVNGTLLPTEIGHLHADPTLGGSLIRCGCGLLGCAEVFAGKGLPLIAREEGRTEDLDARRIIELADQQDDYFQGLLVRSAQAIAEAIRTVAIIHRPQKVFVSGSMGRNPHFFNRLQGVFALLPRPMMFAEAEWNTMLAMAEVAEPGLVGAGAEVFRRAGYLA